MPFILSDKEVTALGYNAAGWSALTALEKSAGKTTYGFGDTPLPDTDSYYHINHKDRTLPQSKDAFIKSVAADELLSNLDKGLNLIQKNDLIKLFNLITKPMMNDLVNALNPGESIKTVIERAGYTAHAFIWMISSHSMESLVSAEALDPLSPDEVIEYEQLKQAFTDFIDLVDQSFPHTKERYREIALNDYSGMQSTMWNSKRIIADTFQENLRRFHANEPLIPIKITIESEKSRFSPDIQGMKDKSDAFVTPTEIRMIYKLMKELNPVSEEIMTGTVTFLKEKADGSFESTQKPWDSMSWLDRPRGERGETKQPYSARSGMPRWIKETLDHKGQGPETLLKTSSPTPAPTAPLPKMTPP